MNSPSMEFSSFNNDPSNKHLEFQTFYQKKKLFGFYSFRAEIVKETR